MVAITLDHDTAAAYPRSVAVPRRGTDLRLVPPSAVRRPSDLLPVDRVLGAVAAAVVLIAVLYLLLAPALAEPGTVSVTDATYVVESGDTMWSVAQEQAPAGEATAYVERLVAVNGTSVVEPGQVLQLPRS